MTSGQCESTFCVGGQCTSGAEGQACNTAVACADGLVCRNSVCVPLLEDEEPCSDGAHCVSTFCAARLCTSSGLGQSCDDDVPCSADVCIDSVCSALILDGESCKDPTHCASTFCIGGKCTAGAEGQTCDGADVACEAPLFCRNGLCTAPFPDGDYCWDPTNCESTFCANGFCTSGLVDQHCLEGNACATEDLYCLNNKCVSKLADGESCGGISESCLSGNCLSGGGTTYCSAATGVGDIPDGEACADDAQCTSLICLQNQCSPPLADGETCANPTHCESTFCINRECTSGAEGQTCDADVPCAAGFCFNSKCVPLLADDENCDDPTHCESTFCVNRECTSGAEGQTCDADVPCAAGFCLNSKCVPLLADDENCDDPTHCESTFCAAGLCTSSGLGQSCDDDVPCSADVCIDSVCSALILDDEGCTDATHCASSFCVEGKCTVGAEGQTCDGADVACEAPLFCLNSVCTAPFLDGIYCWDSTHCESTFCVSGFCTSGLVDQHCLEDNACATEDLYCLNNKCVAKLADGEPCAGINEGCLSGICLSGLGTSYCSVATGVADIPDEAPCTDDAQCTSLICIQNQCSPPLADGESCSLGTHCESTFCAHRKCTSGADGLTCDVDIPCADGLVCINSNCAPLLADGERCQDGTHCESTFCVSGQCTIGAEGQTCDASVACESGLVCILPKCVAPLPDGAYCFDTTHCESGTCDTGFCGVPWWMVEEIARNYDVGADASEDLSDISKGMVVSPDIRYGFTYAPPSSRESDSFAKAISPEDGVSLARWIVHDALWATVSAGKRDLGNPRSTTDGASMAFSSGRPVFNVPNVDISFNPTKASKEVKLSFRERGTCGNTCAEVLMYGKAVRLIENTPEFVAALMSFEATHPMAKWLSEGRSRTSKYYTVVPTRILIHASPGELAVSVGVTEYLGMVFEADKEEVTNVVDPEGFASWAWTTSSASWHKTTVLFVIPSLVMVYHIAF